MTPQQTLAALTVAERFSAIECAVLDRWTGAQVEANPTGGTMFVSTPATSVIITMAFSTFTAGHNVFIQRYDSAGDPHRMHIEGTALDVANEVVEALVEHFGPATARV